MALTDWADFGIKLLAFLGGGAVWAWATLGSFFVKRSEYKDFVNKVESNTSLTKTAIENTEKKLEEIKAFEKNLSSLGQDFAVFKTQYQGDNDLRKEQTQNQQKTLEAQQKLLEKILHQLNNLANVNQKQLLEMIVEERMKKP
jgi:type VI protein secretion system component VasK